MTFSIVGRDERTGCLGIATATGMIAVGAQVPHCAHGVGAIITQGYATNTLFAQDGLPLLAQGNAAEEVLKTVVGRDEGRDYRQLAVMDAQGRTACWTGSGNDGYKAHRDRRNLIVAGNLLTGPAVLAAMESAFEDYALDDMGDCLIAALQAGRDAGGDVRGVCSAALVLDDGDGAAVNLRIDHSKTPIADLRALYERSKDKDYRAFLKRLPDRDHPHRH